MKKQNRGDAPKTDYLLAFEQFCQRFAKPLWAALALVLLAVPLVGTNQYILRIMIMIGVYAMLALGLNILTGYTGLLSLGHAGFFAIGAYTYALLAKNLSWNFIPAFVAAIVITGLFGLVLGLPTMRLSGSYLTIVTLGFGEIVKMVLLSWTDLTNGPMGCSGIPTPSLFGMSLTLKNGGLYYLMLVLLLLVSLFCVVLIRSRTGRAFIAIKDDELAATMMGIQTPRFKMLAFTISAAIAGLAGGFYASVIGYIEPNIFVFDVSTLIISIVVLGGMGTLRGMYLGAALLIAFPEVARALMDWRFVVYGMILIVMMRFRPQGLLGWQSRMPYKRPRLSGYSKERRTV